MYISVNVIFMKCLNKKNILVVFFFQVKSDYFVRYLCNIISFKIITTYVVIKYIKMNLVFMGYIIIRDQIFIQL